MVKPLTERELGVLMVNVQRAYNDEADRAEGTPEEKRLRCRAKHACAGVRALAEALRTGGFVDAEPPAKR